MGHPWIASTWYKGGITITPNTNLVSNIGFGEESTHTSTKDSEFSNMPLKALLENSNTQKKFILMLRQIIGHLIFILEVKPCGSHIISYLCIDAVYHLS